MFFMTGLYTTLCFAMSEEEISQLFSPNISVKDKKKILVNELYEFVKNNPYVNYQDVFRRPSYNNAYNPDDLDGEDKTIMLDEEEFNQGKIRVEVALMANQLNLKDIIYNSNDSISCKLQQGHKRPFF